MSGSGRAVWINNSVKKKKAHIIKRGYRNRISSFFAKDGENRRERMKKISAYYLYGILFYVDFCGKIV